MLIERPVSLSVEAVIESEISVQACSIRACVILRKVERVFVVVHVANLEIPIDPIEDFSADGDVLDFRPADAFQPGRPFAGRQTLADYSEKRPAPEHDCPLVSQANS